MIKRKINKKRIKSILLILVILILFMKNTSVNAGSNDSILIRNKQDGIYAIAPLEDKTHLYNLEMYSINNTPTYCIELGKSITSTIYNSIEEESEQIRISNLSEEQIKHIKELAYFGYQYNYNGQNLHQEKEYYMATQELIWEYLKNIDITWTNELDINGPKINIESYKNEIKELINKYESELTIPNIINTKVGETINYNSNNISLYNVKDEKNITIINNNNLILKIPNNIIGTIKIILESKNSSQKSKIYNIDNSQLLLSKGNIPIKKKEITINISPKTLITNLVDKDTKKSIPQGQATLEGAQYELYDKDNNLITTFITNSTLTNTITNLYNEKYYIKQIKASNGYKLDNTKKEVDLSQKDSIILEEEVIKCPVEITKFYQKDDKLLPEENIEFSFNYYGPTTGKFGSLITPKNGQNRIILPYGKYRITQENTTYGYNKVENLYLHVDKDRTELLKYSLINYPIKTKLNIITKDINTKTNIKEENIEYRIKDINNNYLTHKNNNTFSTTDSGELLLPFTLPYGTYYIEQVTPPKRYLKTNNIEEIIINENSQYINNNDELLLNIDYYNKKIQGKITIHTIEEIINKNSIDIINRKNIEIELYKDDLLINTYITNDEGIIILDNLDLANYCIKEKNNNNKECIDLISDNNEEELIEKNIELKTTRKIDVDETTNIINNESNNDNNTRIIPIPNTLSNKTFSTTDIIITSFLIIGVILYKKVNNYITNN